MRDWQLHIGDTVYQVYDPTHIGRIIRIEWSHRASVRWLDTGWITDDIEIAELRRANRMEYA